MLFSIGTSIGIHDSISKYAIMKKTFNLPSISIVFQLLGVLINGIIGNGFEMIAHIIDTFHGKSSSKVFLRKLFVIFLSQVLINWIFVDNSMTVDMTLWLAEKNYKVFWNGIQMWVAIGNILTLIKIINLRIEILNLILAIFPIHQKHQFELTQKNKNSFVKIDCS